MWEKFEITYIDGQRSSRGVAIWAGTAGKITVVWCMLIYPYRFQAITRMKWWFYRARVVFCSKNINGTFKNKHFSKYHVSISIRISAASALTILEIFVWTGLSIKWTECFIYTPFKYPVCLMIGFWKRQWNVYANGKIMQTKGISIYQWSYCQIPKIADCESTGKCRERFSPPPRVSDPDMHHGTCVDAYAAMHGGIAN